MQRGTCQDPKPCQQMSYFEHLLLVTCLIRFGNGIKNQQPLCHVEVPAAESHNLSQHQPIFPAREEGLIDPSTLSFGADIPLVIKVAHICPYRYTNGSHIPLPLQNGSHIPFI